MARLYAMDTETTGLDSKKGDRIIELAMVEITRSPNPRVYHSYFNPEGRPSAPSALEVHGISDDFLLDKPLFRDCLADILDFIEDGSLVIHNAPFDLEFVRDECLRADQLWPEPPVIDTLVEAGRDFPGSRHGMDALCSRFRIDTTRRTKHSAIIDTELLAEMFLAWKGQSGLDLTTVVAKRSLIDVEKLGAMNDLLIPVVPDILAAPPTRSWEKHFAGIDL